MDTKKLRQKILDLAIRGKLVPQDPNDEPASILLERIRAEKERLIKEGKIKRSKKSATDDEIEAPFEIPMGWAIAKYEQFVTFTGGSQPPKDTFEYEPSESNIRLIQIRDYKTDKFITYIPKAKARRFCSKDDVMIGRYGPPIFQILRGIEGAYNVALMKAEADDRLMSKNYLFYLLQDHKLLELLESISDRTCGQDGVNVNVLNDYVVGIPPLAEQKRIVSAIEKWFTFVDELESNEGDLLKAIDQAKSKILDLAIHGKLVPQNGDWKKQKIKDAFIINPKNRGTDDIMAGFVPMSNIQDGYRDSFVCETRPWGTIKKGFTHFADGDIAVAKISPCLENRKSMVLANLPNGIGAGTTELIVFRCKEDVIPKYGLYFFKTQFFIDSCVGTFNGVVGQQRVGKNIVEEIIIPLPPLAEQYRIVAKIEELFAVLDSIKESLE